MGTQIPGCKLPRHLENPLDDMLMAALHPLMAPMRRAGVTPNGVTLASAAAACASVYLCFQGHHPLAAGSLWFLSYVADVADGMLARQFRMETELGGRLDHGSDVLAFLALTAFVATRLGERPWWPLTVEAGLLAGAWWHLQCQEKDTAHLAFGGIDGTGCADKAHLSVSRWFGTGTLTLWHLFLIGFYSRP